MATTTQNLTKELKKTTDDAVGQVKTTVETVQRDLTETAGDVKDAVGKVFLAGLGALAVAEEEGSKVFKKLVKKGEKIELPGLGMERVQAIREQIEGRADQATDAVKGRVTDAKYVAGQSADKAEDRLQDTVAAVMKRLGVPTREEISELTASVERLTTNIETLKKQRAAESKVVTPGPTPSGDGAPELSVQPVGGGWYEVRLADVVIEKVQGKGEAEKALARIEKERA